MKKSDVGKKMPVDHTKIFILSLKNEEILFEKKKKNTGT
jgi:hypothetical protein